VAKASLTLMKVLLHLSPGEVPIEEEEEVMVSSPDNNEMVDHLWVCRLYANSAFYSVLFLVGSVA